MQCQLETSLHDIDRLLKQKVLKNFLLTSRRVSVKMKTYI